MAAPGARHKWAPKPGTPWARRRAAGDFLGEVEAEKIQSGQGTVAVSFSARHAPGHRRWNIARFAPVLLLISVCAGCGEGSYHAGGRFDGRRGYDGLGDYGYDLTASRAEACDYRRRAAGSYVAPGPAGDPWGPYIREAAGRFAVPERWIREVMRQESGGRLQAADGTLTTSGAGAMGLMQVMPGTYDTLRRQYALGDDPYEPRDNIQAGAAYIREMYDRFGSPGFLAAYNAGPNRVDAYLAGGGELPEETVQYLSNVAPRLGRDAGMTGPLSRFAGMTAGEAPEAELAEADLAFEGGGRVTAEAPTGQLDEPTASVMPSASVRPAGAWGIQVGAFPDLSASRAAISAAMAHSSGQLAGSQPAILPVRRDALLYRARLIGLSADHAQAACSVLQREGLACLTVPPGL